MTRRNTSQDGFSLIELLIVVAIIGIIAAIAIPYLNAARQATMAASAVNSMRTINSAQASYKSSQGTYATLIELGNRQYIADPALSSGEKSGYGFTVGTATDLNYEANADPVVDPQNQFQHYYIDGSAVIRVEVGAVATLASTPID